MILIGYSKCSTCKAIEKLIKSLSITYTFRDLTQDTPSPEELITWYRRSGETNVKKWVNTSGQLYRSGNFKELLANKSDEEVLSIISQDGMLIKRPILIHDNIVCNGSDVAQYLETFKHHE